MMVHRLNKDSATTTNVRGEREVIYKHDYHPAVAEFRALLLDQFELRFNEEREGHKEDLLICCILDPRFKNFTFKGATPEMGKLARKYLTACFLENFLPCLVATPHQELLEVSSSNTLMLEVKKSKTVAASFLESDDESEDDAEELDEVAPSDTHEVDVYLALPEVKDKQFDLLSWWKLHAHMFPNLAKMARQFLALPATSAGIERLFSAAGIIHGDTRKSTKEEKIEDLLFVKQNIDE